jgi:hypothetical protein
MCSQQEHITLFYHLLYLILHSSEAEREPITDNIKRTYNSATDKANHIYHVFQYTFHTQDIRCGKMLREQLFLDLEMTYNFSNFTFLSPYILHCILMAEISSLNYWHWAISVYGG